MTHFIIKRDGRTIASLQSTGPDIAGIAVFTTAKDAFDLSNDVIRGNPIELSFHYANGRQYKGRFVVHEVSFLDKIANVRRYSVRLVAHSVRLLAA